MKRHYESRIALRRFLRNTLKGYLFPRLYYPKDVHCYGQCLHNRRRPKEHDNRLGKWATLAAYKFDLAFENAIARDYVTEKFYDPLIAGCVPVYLGAPNVEEYAPGSNCFIKAADFSGPKELANYLLHLDKHDSEYA